MTTAARDIIRLHPAAATDPEEMLLLTVEEAARQLRIGRTNMYHLVTTGAVGFKVVSRLRRVPIECLHKCVKNRLANGGQHEKTVA
ncbi:MerR family transcriptional regulator [Sphaerisporangium corydalis]|uniref:DNA-binding protein n=1 Tax=Sphaerisporangium corydalis TaxID=1441875 RepID=A0ABV9EGL0_9ACTN|nr:hypothetical protein [Sphaerisporangium corydalis]